MVEGTVAGNKRYYGEAIGIAALDYKLSPAHIPGNVANASSYDFPVRVKIIRGLHDNPFPPIRDKNGELHPDVKLTVEAVRELEADGVRGIVMSCGYFCLLQEVLSNSVNIPLFTSPLLMVPLISRMISKTKKVGIIVASKSRLTEEYLKPAGIDESIAYRIAGMDDCDEFNKCFMQARTTVLDIDRMRNEVVDLAQRFVQEHTDIGVLLLECSDLPPFSGDIQAATGKPVFDYHSFINVLYHSVVPRQYTGIL